MSLKKSFVLLGLAAIFAAGCGSSDNSSPEEANAFKNHDKANVQGPPPGAMKPPANFSSSISGPGPGGPPAGGK